MVVSDSHTKLMNIPNSRVSFSTLISNFRPVSKRAWIAQVLLVLLFALNGFSGRGEIAVQSSERRQKNDWAGENLLSSKKNPAFSFIYDGKNSSELLSSWSRTEKRRTLGDHRVEHVLTWTDPATQLVVKCVAVEYDDFPVVEWTVYFTNPGSKPTPILESIEGLDTILKREKGAEFALNGNQGDYCVAQSFQPFQVKLEASLSTNFSPFAYSGKSCDGPAGWPYYNLQMPGGGIMLAIGWPGQWASSFTRDSSNGLRIKAGQQLTHLSLKPGEQIRTPLIAMFFWKGEDRVRAQNLWRRWYLAHVTPHVNGEGAPTISQIQVSGPQDTNAIADFVKQVIKPDLCWRDAGGGGNTWYPSNLGPYQDGNSWLNTGTWDIDEKKFPEGFKPLSDWLHARDMKFVLWFEPERVGDTKHSFLATNHPAWLLPATGSTVGAILNEGNPEAFQWLTNHIDNIIKSNGLDWYREDMNGDGPLPAWRNNDAPDRQGVTENFYVQGHLTYWDALLAMNPGLRIDSCASGGRRDDLETMRRAVPLLRSDFQFPSQGANIVDGNQCHTYGLSAWLPYQGSGCYLNDPYSFRSFYLASFGMAGEFQLPAWKQAYQENKKIAPILLNGDFYPLTSYSLSNDVWMAWQFDWAGKGRGMVQAFRRGQNSEPVQTYRLSGLNPKAQYKVTNFDVEGSVQMSGRQLMEDGLKIELKNKPQAALITYEKMK